MGRTSPAAGAVRRVHLLQEEAGRSVLVSSRVLDKGLLGQQETQAAPYPPEAGCPTAEGPRSRDPLLCLAPTTPDKSSGVPIRLRKAQR